MWITEAAPCRELCLREADTIDTATECAEFCDQAFSAPPTLRGRLWCIWRGLTSVRRPHVAVVCRVW
jgi:hypothetical protein